MTIRHCLTTITLVAVACVTIHATGISEALQFTTSTSGLGTLPTALSSHLSHWSARHLAWDVAAFALIAFFIQRAGIAACTFWTTIVASTIVIPTVVAFSTELTSYRGLSGIDSAIFALLATHLALIATRDDDRLTAIVAGIGIIGFLAKIIAELAGAGALFAQDLGGAAPVPVAHLTGAVIGMLSAWHSSTLSSTEAAGISATSSP